MPAGRPTDYSDEICRKARQYLRTFDKDGSLIPTIAGLALELKVSRQTVYAWAKEPEKHEFSDIVNEILAKQEILLVNKGLSGDFNPTIAKLALGKHGYSDKVEQEVSGPAGAPLSIVFSGVDSDGRRKN